MSAVAAFVAAQLTGLVLAFLGARVGWTDRPEGAPHRKLAWARVPLVGGAAVLLAVGSVTLATAAEGVAPGGGLDGLPWRALLGAFLLGSIDDLLPKGLPALPKFAGQVFVAALFAHDPGSAWGTPDAGTSAALGLLALVAMNAVNLFDHADGLVSSLGALGLAAARPAFAAAFLGFLPLNTILRKRPEGEHAGEHSTAVAYLGDGGSHLAGIALAAAPLSAWFLLIPVLDLVRVAGGRLISGEPFWRGDRTHLGHRVAALGAGPVATAALIAVLSMPLFGVSVLLRGPVPLAVALLMGFAGYLVVAALSDVDLPAARQAAAPEPEPEPAPEPRSDDDSPSILTPVAPLRAVGRRAGRRLRRGPDRPHGADPDPGPGPSGGPFART